METILLMILVSLSGISSKALFLYIPLSNLDCGIREGMKSEKDPSRGRNCNVSLSEKHRRRRIERLVKGTKKGRKEGKVRKSKEKGKGRRKKERGKEKRHTGGSGNSATICSLS